jgi:hypothetical protein
MKALQLMALMALATSVLLALPAASSIANVVGRISVVCPFSVNTVAQPTYVLPSNVEVYYSLQTLYPCTIPSLDGTFRLLNSSGTVYSANVMDYNVIQANSLYVVSISNSLFRYGIYTANVEFSSFLYSNHSSVSFLVLSPILANALTASNAVADQGQYEVRNLTLTGGTGPFTYN